ncbi:MULTISPECIES: type II secretion system F family protein [Arthrobacter]|uniref:Type II secretion system F family protein n=2 Tax=Arthrobacter TaxID=1663 RepID=A0ABU9KG20_9MICC|nr:type II secretion system F family protein [Arthrobacter sp. YJM1]MDP5225758.1 type II secretion system F family protein [Arthrobacter sp. YJM1]
MGATPAWFLPLGLLAVYAAIIGVFAFLLPRSRTVSRDRRRLGQAKAETAFSRLTRETVGNINSSLRGSRIRFLKVDRLEQAGLRVSMGDLLLRAGAITLIAAVIGFLLGELPIALLAIILTPLAIYLWLNIRISRRQGKFAEQLPDTLQMLSGSMRAGHGFLRAVDSAAEETEEPMSEELRRIVSETRIGRDLVVAMEETAARMKSEDFLWTTQAVETQREVGGNLTEVLDNVHETIKERAQISRQVRALSAEGRTSGVVLIALPIVMLIILSMINPTVATTFFTTVPGWIMLAATAVLLLVGAFWLSRITKIKF